MNGIVTFRGQYEEYGRRVGVERPFASVHRVYMRPVGDGTVDMLILGSKPIGDKKDGGLDFMQQKGVHYIELRLYTFDGGPHYFTQRLYMVDVSRFVLDKGFHDRAVSPGYSARYMLVAQGRMVQEGQATQQEVFDLRKDGRLCEVFPHYTDADQQAMLADFAGYLAPARPTPPPAAKPPVIPDVMRYVTPPAPAPAPAPVPVSARGTVRQRAGALDAYERERVLAAVTHKGPDDCWPMRKKTVSIAKRQVPTHKVLWELANGPVPDRKALIHTCQNDTCANPAHMCLIGGRTGVRAQQ